jgi:hypothetical protein
MYSWYQALIVVALLKICLAAESDPTCVHFYNAKESEGCNTDSFNLPTDIRYALISTLNVIRYFANPKKSQ